MRHTEAQKGNVNKHVMNKEKAEELLGDSPQSPVAENNAENEKCLICGYFAIKYAALPWTCIELQ